MVDLRYHWARQKRLQGWHGTNDTQAYAYNDLVRAGQIDPVVGRVLPFADIPRSHVQMGRGEEVFGNTVHLVVPGTRPSDATDTAGPSLGDRCDGASLAVAPRDGLTSFSVRM